MGKHIPVKCLLRWEVRARYRNRLRECRLRGLIINEAELARRTGIERTTISALENNHRFLSIEQALLIREVLGCSLDDLYEKVPFPDSVVLASEPGRVQQ